MDNNDLRDTVEETYWATQFTADGQIREMGGPAAFLAEQLNALGYDPKWRDASQLGVELVDHLDSSVGVFHLASGDVVYPTQTGYEILEGARTGKSVLSGTMQRIHNPGVDPNARIHPTASIDPNARIEAGAVIGPRASVGRDAHVGRNAYVGQSSTVCAGAFVGPGTTVRGGSIIGEGAVVGAGSDIGSCSQIGPGSAIEQGTTVDGHSKVTAGEKVTKANGRHAGHSPASQLAHAVERLLSMDRD